MTREARPSLRGDRGIVAIELLGYLPLFLLVVLVAFQLQTIAAAASVAENAARTGSRVASRGGDGVAAAIDAVDPGLRRHAEAGRGSGCRGGVGGTRITVCIDVPIVIPWIDLEIVEVRRSAVLPPGYGVGL